MRLGIIAPVAEESFRYAHELGLDFVEFCINRDDHGEQLYRYENEIPEWMYKYSVGIGSIGRWDVNEINPDGSINQYELSIARELMRFCEKFHCPNYVCGCNYWNHMSRFSNYASAINFFENVLNSAPQGVRVSVYNCRNSNFVNNEEAWSLVLGHLPALGLKYDPSHSIYAGSDYLQELMNWGDRIYHFHLKGSMAVNGVRIDDPPAGLDRTDWRTVINILRIKGYDGGLSIEPHSHIWQGELGDRGVRYTVKYFKELLLMD